MYRTTNCSSTSPHNDIIVRVSQLESFVNAEEIHYDGSLDVKK